MRRLLRCCGGSAAKEKVEIVKDDAEAFCPQCSCATFRSTGSCRHLPPALPEIAISDGAKEKEAASEIVVQAPDPLPKLELPGGDDALHFIEEIGRGASGAVVMRCTAATTPGGSGAQQCAAKVLPLSRAVFADHVEDFGTEVEMLQKLGRHPELVAFFGAWHLSSFGPDGLEAYALCIELCDGALEGTVRRRRERLEPFEEMELISCLGQVSSGLAHLHRLRVLHRDLKSANVFLKRERDGELEEDVRDLSLEHVRAKLGDFGAAKASSRAQTPVQTPHFMAPEVARQEGYGAPADMWAFGCLIFELLELGLPYGEDLTLPELDAALLSGKGPRLADRRGCESRAPQIVALMDTCLSEAVSGRPKAAEVASQLSGDFSSQGKMPGELPSELAQDKESGHIDGSEKMSHVEKPI